MLHENLPTFIIAIYVETNDSHNVLYDNQGKGKAGENTTGCVSAHFSKSIILLSETIVKQKSYQVGRYGITVSTNSKYINICILLFELYRYSCLPQMNVSILF